jgi:hypothetical protein
MARPAAALVNDEAELDEPVARGPFADTAVLFVMPSITWRNYQLCLEPRAHQFSPTANTLRRRDRPNRISGAAVEPEWRARTPTEQQEARTRATSLLTQIAARFGAMVPQVREHMIDAFRALVSVEEALAFKTTGGDAAAAYTAWLNAKQAATNASDAWKNAKKALRTAASTGVKSIRNFAQQQKDPQVVYGLAQVPAPKTPNFAVPPGTPTAATVTLDVNSGNLEVRFECNNPPGLSGTFYIVQRCTATATAPTSFGPWQQAAVTSVKRFTDTTITAGTAAVQYIITARRGMIVGNASLPITVQFGRAGGTGTGPSALTVTEGELIDAATNASGNRPKLAA